MSVLYRYDVDSTDHLLTVDQTKVTVTELDTSLDVSGEPSLRFL